MVATRNSRDRSADEPAQQQLLCCSGGHSDSSADEPLEHGEGIAPEQAAIQVAMKGCRFRATSCWNQDGERIHFYRDLVEGKVVAINTIFTTCLTILPNNGPLFRRASE